MNRQADDPQATGTTQDELDFSDGSGDRSLGQHPLDEVEQAPRQPVDGLGMTGGATLTESEHEDHVSLDDLSPDTLFDQSGARSPHEAWGDGPADEQLRTVEEHEIGGGSGLDEAELAHSAPLDGQPWNDDADEEGQP